MSNSSFEQQEWELLCERLERSADRLAANEEQQRSFRSAAGQFSEQAPPASYAELLERVSQASRLAIGWQQSSRDANLASAPSVEAQSSGGFVDEASQESFPASDPPAWSPTHA